VTPQPQQPEQMYLISESILQRAEDYGDLLDDDIAIIRSRPAPAPDGVMKLLDEIDKRLPTPFMINDTEALCYVSGSAIAWIHKEIKSLRQEAQR